MRYCSITGKYAIDVDGFIKIKSNNDGLVEKYKTKLVANDI
jgi:hypothetical protein